MPQSFGCGTCPAYEAPEGADAGTCHGDVPNVFLLTATDALGRPQLRTQSAWRPVNAKTDWCAKHPLFSWDAVPIDGRLAARAEGQA